MRSPELRILRSRLSRLKGYFLPRRWDPLGAYPDRSRERATAYFVLAHAEFEEYLEKRSLSSARKAVSDWNQNSLTSKALIRLAEVAHEDAPTKAQSLTLSDLLKTGLLKYEHRVRLNHGIKTANIERLLPPAGIELDDLPSGLSAQLNTFGGKRGAYAHTSGHARRLIDPKTTCDSVELVYRLISEVDAMFL